MPQLVTVQLQKTPTLVWDRTQVIKPKDIVDSLEYPSLPEKSYNKANLVKIPHDQESASNIDYNIKNEFILVSSRKKKICENYVEKEIKNPVNKSYSNVINKQESANSIQNKLEFPYLPGTKSIPNKTITGKTSVNELQHKPQKYKSIAHVCPANFSI